MSQLIRSITLKSGPQGPCEPLTFELGSVTLFVGPNHSGKSSVLREIREAFANPKRPEHSMVLFGMNFNAFSPELRKRFESQLEQISRFHGNDSDALVDIHLEGKHITSTIAGYKDSLSFIKHITGLRQVFGVTGRNWASSLCLLLNGKERLDLMNSSGREELRVQMSSKLGILFQNNNKPERSSANPL